MSRPPPRGAEPGYIALRVKREPLDETDMKNDVECYLKFNFEIFEELWFSLFNLWLKLVTSLYPP
jgi:hypothetical protein